jgi:hypothetical protein
MLHEMADSDKIKKRKRLGSASKPDVRSILRDEQGNVVQFRHPDDVLFIFCQNCGGLFTADNRKAHEMAYAASILAGYNKEDFPQHLLDENCSFEGYYLELGMCKYCINTDKTTGRIKKIP